MLDGGMCERAEHGDGVYLVGAAVLMCLDPGVGGACEPVDFVVRDVFEGCAIRGATTVFHLNNVDAAGPSGNNVELAPAVAPVAVEDGEAGGGEVGGGELFGGTASGGGGIVRGHG